LTYYFVSDDVWVATGDGVKLPRVKFGTAGRKALDEELAALERARSAETALGPAGADKSAQPSKRSPKQRITRANTRPFITHHDTTIEVSLWPNHSIEKIERTATDCPN
jgi:hypothetical protein